MAASPGSGTSPRVKFGGDELLAPGENVENVLDLLVGEVVVVVVVVMGVVVVVGVVNIVGVVGVQG